MKKILSLLKYSANPDMYCRKKSFKNRFTNFNLLDLVITAIGFIIFHLVIINVFDIAVKSCALCFSGLYFILLTFLMLILDRRRHASVRVFYVFMIGFALLPVVYTYLFTIAYFIVMYAFSKTKEIPWMLQDCNTTYLILWFAFAVSWSAALLSINAKSLLKSSFFVSAMGILSLSISYSWMYPRVVSLL